MLTRLFEFSRLECPYDAFFFFRVSHGRFRYHFLLECLPDTICGLGGMVMRANELIPNGKQGAGRSSVHHLHSFVLCI